MRRGDENHLMEDLSKQQRSAGGKRKMTDSDYHVGGDELPPFKRCRQGEGPSIELRVLLKSNASGAIIGKSGTNIKRLRESFKATVTIPDCNGPERILTISADLGTCLEILRDSLPRTVETTQDARGPQDVEVRLLIHQSQAGGVIGKAGQRIKEIREATNAHVKVFAQCCPMSTDRVVLISGKVDQVADTVQQVIEIANDAGIKGTSQHYDPFNFDEFNAVEYGGYGGGGGAGGGGGGGGGGGNFGGGRGGMGDGLGMSWGDGRGGGRGGMRGGRGGGGGGGGGSLMSNRGMPARGGMNRGGGRGGFDGGHFRNSGNGQGMSDAAFPGHPNTANSQGEQASQQVSIPKDLAATEERVITINGTEEQIQNAQYLMQMAVRQHSGKF